MEQSKSNSAITRTQQRVTESAAITVLLTNDQIAQLDEIAAAIRRNSGRSISRSALIRAMITAATTLRADWRLCHDEDDVCLWILARLSNTLDCRGAEQKLRHLKPGTNLSFAT
jgi:hypothetical protein